MDPGTNLSKYPTACGKPAAVPGPRDRFSDGTIDRSIDRPIYSPDVGSLFQVFGGSLWHPGRFPPRSRIDEKSPKIDPKSTQNRSQIDRNRPKTVKNRTSGTLWAPRGVRGRKLMENVGSRVLARAPILGHLGDIWHHLADIFSVLGCKKSDPLHDRRFDGQSVRKWTAECG